MKEEIKQELLAEMRRAPQGKGEGAEPEAGAGGGAGGSVTFYKAISLGGAEGRMLRDGEGLADCDVMLVRMVGVVGFPAFGGSFVQDPDSEYATRTDATGAFLFERIPVGYYKIKWQLPGDRGWIQRARDRPDVKIRKGVVSTVKPIETHKTIIRR